MIILFTMLLPQRSNIPSIYPPLFVLWAGWNGVKKSEMERVITLSSSTSHGRWGIVSATDVAVSTVSDDEVDLPNLFFFFFLVGEATADCGDTADGEATSSFLVAM